MGELYWLIATKMVKLKELKQIIRIPEGVTFDIVDSYLYLKGSKGENKKKILRSIIKIKKQGDSILLDSSKSTRKEKKLLMTLKAHIKNLIRGVLEGYTYKLKVCSGHFPMNVTLENKTLSIKNFLGEKIPRKSKILDDVDVKIDGDIITVTGVDKEKTGQTAANIEQSTRVTNRDRRVFQDGCYIISKPGRS